MLEYKEMQVVDTDRNWILFCVPSEVNPELFSNLLRPFLQDQMWRMKDKNPSKYTASKYSGTLPEFVASVMYVQNAPMKMTEGLPAFAKQCIHLEIRESDKELSQAVFNYILLAKADEGSLASSLAFTTVLELAPQSQKRMIWVVCFKITWR